MNSNERSPFSGTKRVNPFRKYQYRYFHNHKFYIFFWVFYIFHFIILLFLLKLVKALKRSLYTVVLNQFLGHYGSIWLIMARYGSLYLNGCTKLIFGSLWVILAHYGMLWVIIFIRLYYWLIMGHFG